MLEHLLRLLGKTEDKSTAPALEPQVAACVLFVEMAAIDGDVADVEDRAIRTALADQLGLSAADVGTLIAEARSQARQSIDLWRFTSRVNEHYSTSEKLDIVEALWRIVYADGRVDDHERHLMHKLTNLLNLEQQQVFERKCRARDSIAS
jgi:uncharacterized tellurite resistance protein B-like protein